MTAGPPRPACFVAMPSGKKSAPDDPSLVVAFDEVWDALRQALEGAGYEAIRAGFEHSGGFAHRAMYERLMVAELVVADMTFGSPSVAYEVGVRQGAGGAHTVLIGARRWVANARALPFDYRPLRVLPYETAADGSLPAGAGAALGAALLERIAGERSGLARTDNPLLQAAGLAASEWPAHEKTDVFMARMQYVSGRTRRIWDAVSRRDGADELDVIEREVTAGNASGEIPELHTTLLALYIGWREKKRFDRMVALFDRFPDELKRTPVALEQLALARNRLAEEAAQRGDRARADELRAGALAAAGLLPRERWSSETWSIVGRIHKGAHRAAADDQGRRAALEEAIRAYEAGFASDPRDFFPGSNAVTLRAIRDEAEDRERLEALLPAVRLSVDRAPAGTHHDAYWQGATRLGLACVKRSWDEARKHLLQLLGLKHEPWMQAWMYETTADSLEQLQEARRAEADTAKTLGAMAAELRMAKAS